MTVEQAIERVRRAGSIQLICGAIHYEIRRRSPEITQALATIKAHKSEALQYLSMTTTPPRTEPMESALKGSAVELWSDSAGRLFLVADEEEDACRVMEQLGAPRGEIYTAAEARRIITVKDPAVVAEIHDWKRRFEGVVRDFRPGMLQNDEICPEPRSTPSGRAYRSPGFWCHRAYLDSRRPALLRTRSSHRSDDQLDSEPQPGSDAGNADLTLKKEFESLFNQLSRLGDGVVDIEVPHRLPFRLVLERRIEGLL
jgi:hypothetical protein